MNAAQRRKTHTARELVDKGRRATQFEARAVAAEKRIAELEEEIAQRRSYMEVLAREHGLLSAKAAALEPEHLDLRFRLQDAENNLAAAGLELLKLRRELTKAHAEDRDAKKLRRRLQARSETLAAALQRIHTLEEILRANYIRF